MQRAGEMARQYSFDLDALYLERPSLKKHADKLIGQNPYGTDSCAEPAIPEVDESGGSGLAGLQGSSESDYL